MDTRKSKDSCQKLLDLLALESRPSLPDHLRHGTKPCKAAALAPLAPSPEPQNHDLDIRLKLVCFAIVEQDWRVIEVSSRHWTQALCVPMLVKRVVDVGKFQVRRQIWNVEKEGTRWHKVLATECVRLRQSQVVPGNGMQAERQLHSEIVVLTLLLPRRLRLRAFTRDAPSA